MEFIKSKQIYILSFSTVILWASAFPITKIAQEHFSPIPLAFLRCSLTAITLLVIYLMKGARLPKLKDIPIFICTGLSGFGLYLVLFNTAMESITAATASIMVAVSPILTAILATVIYKEKIHISGWICILFAFIGVVVLLLWEGVLSLNTGVIWMFSAAFVFSFYNNLSRTLSKKGYAPLEIITYSFLFSMIFLSFASVEGYRELVTAEPIHIFAGAYLALLSSGLAFFIWGKALSMTEKATKVTNFMFLTPFLSTLLGFLLLDEVPNAGTYIGGIMIIGSMIVFNLVEAKVKKEDVAKEENLIGSQVEG